MTMGISRIFRSTDVGAPQLVATAAGSLNTVLKAVLVNGYGSTASLGWTKEFETGNICVFRMAGGTRTFVRIDNGQTLNYNYDVSAFVTMSSVNNGTERCPAVGLNLVGWYAGGPQAGNIPWIIIGDEAGIWITTKGFRYSDAGTFLTGLWMSTYIGDYLRFNIKNVWNFCIFMGNAFRCFYPGSSYMNGNNSILRGPAFYKGSKRATLQSYITPNTSSPFGSSGLDLKMSSSAVLDWTGLNGVYFGVPIYIVDTETSVLMGTLPGFLEPILNVPDSAQGFSPGYPTIETIDSSGGSVFMCGYNPLQGDRAVYIGKSLISYGKGFRNV